MSATHRPPLPPGPWLVVGLARSGAAAARALWARGEAVICVDAGDPDEAAALRHEGLEVRTGADGLEELGRARAVVKSPGVPREAPVIAAARARGIEVLGELELGWRLLDRPFVAVTGTNGKTTVVELLGAMWRAAGRPVVVAGNVGTAVSSLGTDLDPQTTVICEASSFQLEDAVAFAPQVAVILNLTADHLDRHGTLDDYAAAKRAIFAHQPAGTFAVGPAELLRAAGGEAERVTVGDDAEATLALDGGELRWRGTPLLRADEIALPGAHNLRNAMAAAAAALSAGLPADAVVAALRSFEGVEHRLELAGEFRGVRFVNDSKATNVASTLVALAAVDRPLHLILGGQGKGQDFTPLRAAIAAARSVWLIGEDAPLLERALGPDARVVQAGTLEAAVAGAAAAAVAGEAVLLSPACASFDQFAGYEARGACFKELVAALATDR